MAWWSGIWKAVKWVAKKIITKVVIPVIVAVIETVIGIILSKYYNESESSNKEDFPNTALAGEFPYHASIHQDNVHYCSGAYIGTFFILTVAQCVYTFANDQIQKSKLKVYVGIRAVPSYSAFDYAVDKITLHPRFDANVLAYNVAILKLTQKVTNPPFVRPIPLPSPDMDIVKTTVLVSGFKNLNAPSILTGMTKSQMIIIEHKICRSHFSKKMVTSGKFCVIPAPRWKPCQTSRGGTAASKDNILIGLFIMQNIKGCAKDLPEIFLHVRVFLDFIKDAAK